MTRQSRLINPVIRWATFEPNMDVAAQFSAIEKRAFPVRVPFAFPTVTIRPMEVRTFLARFTV